MFELTKLYRVGYVLNGTENEFAIVANTITEAIDKTQQGAPNAAIVYVSFVESVIV